MGNCGGKQKHTTGGGQSIQIKSTPTNPTVTPATVQKEYDHLYKVLILGESGVGKTSLLLTFCDNVFPNKPVTNIGSGDTRDKILNVDGTRTKLQCWDTAGQERFRTITGVILCYSVNSKESFDNIEGWITQLDSYVSTKVPKILVGLKSDLDNREVTSEQGRAKAQELNLQWLECSAKEGVNVTETFLVMARVIKSAKAGANSDSDD